MRLSIVWGIATLAVFSPGTHVRAHDAPSLFAPLDMLTAGSTAARDVAVEAVLLRASDAIRAHAEAVTAGPTSKCPLHPRAVPGYPGPGPRVTAALANVTREAAASVNGKTATGCYVTVSYLGRQLLASGFGSADGTPGGAAPTADTAFRIASVSKVVALLLANAAVEDGLISSMSDTLGAHIPGGFNMLPPGRSGTNPTALGTRELGGDRGGNDVTFDQLMSHQGGMPREGPCTATIFNLCNDTTASMAAKLREWSLISEPWHAPSYSNIGFSLLGNVASDLYAARSPSRAVPSAAVAPGHTNFSVVATQRIFSRLNMTGTGFDLAGRPNAAVGFSAPGLPWNASIVFGFGDPAGGVVSTARDLNALADALVLPWTSSAAPPANGAPPPVLTPRRVLALTQPARWINPDGATGWGTPWEIVLVGGYSVRRKAGNLAAWAASFAIVPELGLSVVALWNGPHDSNGFSRSVAEWVVPALASELVPLQPGPRAPPAGVQYAGVYSAGQWVAKVTVPSPGRMVLSHSGWSVLLDYVGPASNSDVQTFRMFVPQGLESCMQDGFGAYNGELVGFLVKEGTSVASAIGFPGISPYVVAPRTGQ